MKCARCGRTFFRHSFINANWCAQDQVFLCRKCAASTGQRATCPACRGRTSIGHPVFLVVAIVSILFGLSFGGVFLAMDLVDRSYQFAPMTPMATAGSGSMVKIVGVIQGGQGTVVMDGIYIQAGKSSHWSWTCYNFFLLVDNTTILVNVGQLGNSVYGSPHDLSSNHEQYRVGDTAAVVGVVTSPAGMNAKAVAPYPAGFWGAWEDYASGIPLTIGGIFMGVALVLHLINTRRSRQHVANVANANPFAYQPPVEAPPTAPLP